MKINTHLKLIASLGLALTLCLGQTGSVKAATGPFVCSSNFYQVISGQLKLLDPTSGAYTGIGVQQADNYNGIGYNVLDNYIYGFKTSVTDGIGAVGNLVRVASDGAVTDLGPVSGMPAGNYVNGSFDLAGNLYVRAGNNSLYKVNVAGVSATTITTTGDSITSALDNVLINNKLYFLSGSTLSIVDLGTNVATNVTVNGSNGWLSAGNGFGAGWTDNAGELFFSNNGNGSVYQISGFTTASPSASFKIAGTVTSNNDGTSCPLAVQNPFQAPVVINNTYGASSSGANRQISGSLLTNDIGSGLTVTANTSPAHGSVIVNPDGSFVYTPNANFSGNDSFDYTVTDMFGRSTTATATLSVAGAAAATAAIGAPDTGYGLPSGENALITDVLVASLVLAAVGWRLRRPAL